MACVELSRKGKLKRRNYHMSLLVSSLNELETSVLSLASYVYLALNLQRKRFYSSQPLPFPSADRYSRNVQYLKSISRRLRHGS